MSQLSKQDLKAENQLEFPNNNVGAILPSNLRAFNVDMIDSTVNQTSFDSFSGSVASQFANITASGGDITSLNQYTASNDQKWSNIGGQSGSWVTSAITASSLVTASFASHTLTFTKGDGTTFGLNIPDISGSTVDTGSLVSTASFNSYTQSNDTKWNTLGGQSGSWVTSAITASSLITASVNLNTITFTKGDASTFAITVNTGSGGGGTTDISSLNAYTASQNTKNTTLQNVTASLQSATASLFTSASNALVTGSIAGQILQFKKGDNSTFNINLPSGSGTVVTGSYAQFYDTTTQSGSANTPYALKFPQTAVPDGVILSGSTGMQVGAAGVYNIQFSLQAVQGASSANLNVWFKKNGVNIANSDTQWTLPSNTKLVPVVNILDQAALNDVYEIWWQSDSANTTFAAIAPGTYSPEVPSAIVTIYRVDVGGGTNSVTTGSFNAYTASMNAFTSSINSYTASNDTKWSTLGGLTGSFATTGSNVFIGNETLQDGAGNASTLVPTSGSIMLVAKSYTSASSHLSASSTAFINLIFKDNNLSGDTIISGSGNIFTNPNAATAGFKRIIGGASNYYLGANSIPNISASMAFPFTNNGNIWGGSLTMRGPVSSSAWVFSSNIGNGTVNIGQSATLNAQRLVSGVTINNNIIPGTLTINANQNNLANPFTFNNNYLAGGATLTLSSSAAGITNNIINDSGFTFTNNYWTGSIGTGSVAINRNNIAGQNNALIISGAYATGSVLPSLSDNAFFGGNNTAYVDATGTAYKDFLRTIIAGNQLIATGSVLLSDTEGNLGTAVFGRYNANDGIRNKTRENVFIVGTGNAQGRKTGFLIDSGSNTFVEGTLNVSGSTSISGALNLTGSAYGNVVSMSIASNTASMDLSTGNYFELTASVTPLRIELSNLKGGTTKTLALSGSTASTITFSSNVLQPSGSAYTASVSGQTDILSFVVFNTAKANVVSTLNMI